MPQRTPYVRPSARLLAPWLRGAVRYAGAPRVAVAVAGLALLDCSGAAPRPDHELPSCTLNAAAPRPKLAAAKPLTPAVSELLLRVEHLSKSQLIAELERQIPRQLAKADDQSVGAPGRASYRVTRAPLAVHVVDNQLKVVTDVMADISVCKPLGPVCIGYGSCQPVFVSEFSMPLALTPDYAWAPLAASISPKVGCRIAILDVTRQLHGMARGELGKVRNRVERSLPRFRQELAQAFRLVQMPIFVDAERCVRLEPERVFQGPVEETDGSFSLSAGLRGVLSLSDRCESPSDPLPLPELEQETQAPTSGLLRVVSVLSLEELERELARRVLSSSMNGVKVAKLELATFRGGPGKGNQLGLGLTLQGRGCGKLWLSASPRAVDRDHVGFELTSTLNPEGVNEQSLTPFLSELERRLLVPVPAALKTVDRKLAEWLELAQGLLEDELVKRNVPDTWRPVLKASVKRAPELELALGDQGVRIVAPLLVELALSFGEPP